MKTVSKIWNEAIAAVRQGLDFLPRASMGDSILSRRIHDMLDKLHAQMSEDLPTATERPMREMVLDALRDELDKCHRNIGGHSSNCAGLVAAGLAPHMAECARAIASLGLPVGCFTSTRESPSSERYVVRDTNFGNVNVANAVVLNTRTNTTIALFANKIDANRYCEGLNERLHKITYGR